MEENKKIEALCEIENINDLIKSGDYTEARDKLVKVKKRFSDLDDISEMIVASEVLCSSNLDVLRCGCDWYWVLQVKPDADQADILYRYKKLIKQLEPISTSFPGAKLALETVKSAFLVLSDPDKRLEFDTKRTAGLNDLGSTDVSSAVDKPCEDSNFYDFGKIRTAMVFSVGQVWAAYDKENMPRKYAWVSSIDQSPFKMRVCWLKHDAILECERSWCEAGLPVVCGFFHIDKTNQSIVTSLGAFSHLFLRCTSQNERINISPKKHEIWAIYKDWKPFEWILNPEARKTCRLQIVEILTDYSDYEETVVVGLVRVTGYKTVFKRYTKNGDEQRFTIPGKCLYKFSHSLPAYRFVAGERNDEFKGMLHLDPLAIPDLLDCTPEASDTTAVMRPMEAPYPEAKPVKCRWSAKDFVSGQIWAVQDGFDSMPRQYVIVHKLVSDSDVSVLILEPHPVLNEERHWVEQKLPIVCGLFRVGKTLLHLKMSQFSHLVVCEFISNWSFYKINPKKGEVWAMYTNWDSKWKKSDFTSSYKCGIVEIISDFCNESGLIVAKLEEVPGCATFFRKQVSDGFELIRAVPRREMLSFSHKIDAFTVPGVGVLGIPEGSWHLEASSLPPKHHK